MLMSQSSGTCSGWWSCGSDVMGDFMLFIVKGLRDGWELRQDGLTLRLVSRKLEGWMESSYFQGVY